MRLISLILLLSINSSMGGKVNAQPFHEEKFNLIRLVKLDAADGKITIAAGRVELIFCMNSVC